MTLEIRPLQHRRYRIFSDGTFVAGYTLGEFRPYIYPLCTPRGTPVTEESPPDHPHHQSLWLGQDEVNGTNFWLNKPSCGRVEGADPDVSVERMPDGTSAAVFRHDLTWREPGGTVALLERRVTAVSATLRAVTVDVHSTRWSDDGPVELGQTKEAGLGLRVFDPLDEDDGGLLLNSAGGHGESETFDRDADWVDCSGLVGGRLVGAALFAHPRNPRHPWFTRAYGIVLLNHHRFQRQVLAPGERLVLSWRVVVHDGSASDAGVADLYRQYRAHAGPIDRFLTGARSSARRRARPTVGRSTS